MIRKYFEAMTGNTKPDYLDVFLLGLLPICISMALGIFIYGAIHFTPFRIAFGGIVGYLLLVYFVHKWLNK